MTHSEQEEILRRALHAVADTIEPAADGLERIRERLSRPRPLVVAWAMAGWTSLVQALQVRVEPAAEGAAGRLSERLSSWLRLMIRSLGVAGERVRPAIEALVAAARGLRPGSGMSRHEKLRSAIAFGAAALIGAAGGFALSAGLPQQMISAASSAFSSGSPHHTGSGGHNAGTSTGSGQTFPTAPGTVPGSTRKPTASPTPSCRPSPTTSMTSSPPVTPTTTSPSTSPTSPPPTTPTVNPSTGTPSSGGTPTQTATQSPGGVGPSTAPNKNTHSGIVSGTAGSTPTSTKSPSRTNQTAAGVHPAASATQSTPGVRPSSIVVPPC